LGAWVLITETWYKAAFGTIFHSPDVEATQYGMAKWNKSVWLQLYS
jgi:hypothetical protein